MRKLLLPLTIAIAAAAAYPALAGTRSVTIGDNYFVRDGSAPTVTISHGSSVRWVWRGESRHNVTVSSGPARFHSHTQSTGSYTKLLTARGTYHIYCSIHGADEMSMKVVVR